MQKWFEMKSFKTLSVHQNNLLDVMCSKKKPFPRSRMPASIEKFIKASCLFKEEYRYDITITKDISELTPQYVDGEYQSGPGELLSCSMGSRSWQFTLCVSIAGWWYLMVCSNGSIFQVFILEKPQSLCSKQDKSVKNNIGVKCCCFHMADLWILILWEDSLHIFHQYFNQVEKVKKKIYFTNASSCIHLMLICHWAFNLKAFNGHTPA